MRNGDHCRNNSHGILPRCWIRQLEWQRGRDVFIARKWRDAIRDLTASPKDILRTLGGSSSGDLGLASVVSLIIAPVALGLIRRIYSTAVSPGG